MSPTGRRGFRGPRAGPRPGWRRGRKKHALEIRFEHDLGQEPPTAWAAEIDQMIVRGSQIHREAVFFHRASRTLILTDLIENFEPAKLGFWFRLVTRLVGIQHPDGAMPPDMRATFRDRAALREDVERMIAWAPERVILAHGRWYETNAVTELRRAFRRVL
jgi:hypothetical protein